MAEYAHEGTTQALLRAWTMRWCHERHDVCATASASLVPLLPVEEMLVGSSPPAKHLFSRSGLGDGRLDEVSQLHPCPVAPHHHGVLAQEVL